MAATVQRGRLVLTRVAAVLVVLLLFGNEIRLAIEHYGQRYGTRGMLESRGLDVGLLAVLLFPFVILWTSSGFRHADAAVITAVFAIVIGGALRRGLVTHVGWLDVAEAVVVIGSALLLAFGRGKPDEIIPIVRLRRRNESRQLPRLNERRRRNGQAPVSSFHEAQREIPPDERRRRRGLSITNGILLYGGVKALVDDVTHLGHHEQHVPTTLGLISFVLGIALLVGAWWFSSFRHRTWVLGGQLIALLTIGFIESAWNHHRITLVSVVCELAWLALIVLQSRNSEPHDAG